MTDHAAWTIHVDGAARGNPGPAAYAYVIKRPGMPAIEEKGCLGEATNNLAEYTALVRALERAVQLGGKRLMIHSDSELLVKQMNGEYRVKNPDLLALFEEAKDLCRGLDSVTLRHVRREHNRRADQLCNEALDEQAKRSCPKPSSGKSAKKTKIATGSDRIQAVHDEAIVCLKAAANSWARGDAACPPAEAVWEQLWSILEENGVVR